MSEKNVMEDAEERLSKVDGTSKEIVEGILIKTQEIKEVRTKLNKEKSALLKKIKEKYDRKIVRIGVDVAKFEESAKMIVGPKTFFKMRAKFNNDLKKDSGKTNKIRAEADPLGNQIKGMTKDVQGASNFNEPDEDV